MHSLRRTRCRDAFRTVNQFRRFLNGIAGRNIENPACRALGIKPLGHLDTDGNGENDDIGSVNLLLGQFIVDAHAALRLDLAVDAALFALLLERFLRHIGMRNACSTGGYAYDLHRKSSSISCSSW